jgi:hypothetical protein
MDFKQKLINQLKIIKDLYKNKKYGYANFKIKLNYDYLIKLAQSLVSNENADSDDISPILESIEKIILYHNNKELGLKTDFLILNELDNLLNYLKKNLDVKNVIDLDLLNQMSLRDLNNLVHLENLFKNNINNSIKYYDKLKNLIDNHAIIEDTIFEPIYIKIGTIENYYNGGEPNLFIYEHKILKKMLNDIDNLIDNLISNFDYRILIDNLDRYFYFKNTWEHHSLREKNIFYKFLDDKVSNYLSTNELFEIKNKLISIFD